MAQDRRTQSREATEQELKKVALQLFSEKGFHYTSTKEITTAAGVAKGTLYWYWKSKEELAFSLVSDMLSAFLDLIDKAAASRGPVRERLERLVGEVADLYYQEKEYCRLLWKFRADRHYIFTPEYKDHVANYYVLIRKGIAGLVADGIRGGEFKEVDPDYIAFLVLGITEGLEVEWLENESEFSMGEGLRHVMGLLLDSMKR
jgi:AcrR family transcriptional regulator